MCPNRVSTTMQEPVNLSVRCAAWWVFGLVGAGMGLLGIGWLYNANLARTNEKRVEVIESRLLDQTKTLDAIQTDVKEMLRRSYQSRTSVDSRMGEG